MKVRKLVWFCLIAACLPAPAVMAQQHIIQQESEAAWTDGPPGLPLGAKMMLLHGDPAGAGLFGLRVKFPANYRIPAHYHSVSEQVTVISGTLYLGMGDRLDLNGGKPLGPGGFGLLPAKMNHYAYTRGPVTAVLYGNGPFDIQYLDPADDPRGKASAK